MKPMPSELRELSMFAAVNHAVRSMIEHRKNLVNMTWAWTLIVLAVNLAFAVFVGWEVIGSPEPAKFAQIQNPVSGMLMLALFVVPGVAGAVIAIAWHRLILQGRLPKDILLLEHDTPLIPYLVKWVGYALLALLKSFLLIMVLATPVIFLVATTVQPLPRPYSAQQYDGILVAVLGLPVIYFFLRLCLGLPDLAIGNRANSGWLLKRFSMPLRKMIFGSALAIVALFTLHALITIGWAWLSGSIFLDWPMISAVLNALASAAIFPLTTVFLAGVISALYGFMMGLIPLDQGKSIKGTLSAT